MEVIDLDTAVDHIKQACEDDVSEHPFFFLVGAGISHPPIPLSSAIVEYCQATARQHMGTSKHPGNTPIDIYSHWFQQAYPHPIQRQGYLRNLIEGKPISAANLRLAHLLLEKKITNLVVTPNFDTFLSQALMLFGEQPIVCDHPNTVDRIDPERPDLQIVHVHGTYWFYDCCNLRDEIEARSRSSAHTTSTMASLLDRFLSRRSPLIIGYGGWEGDVIMTALRRRLQTPLAYNLYWFCYRRADVDLLPTWLKETHQSVCFVVPPQGELSKQSLEELSEREFGGKSEAKRLPRSEAKGLVEKESAQDTLSAQAVLEKLIQSFDLKAPQLTSDPLGFLAQFLRRSLLEEHVKGAEADIYYIRSVIIRLERAKQREIATVKSIESLLEKVQDAMRRSQYGDAIRLVVGVDKGDIAEPQLRELMDVMWTAASHVQNNSDDELHACDQVISIGEKLLAQGIDEPRQRERVAGALLNKGATFCDLGRHEEAIAISDEVVRRFGEATDPGTRERVAGVLANKGFTLRKLGRHAEAIAVYDEVVRRFGEATEPAVREQVASALVDKGTTLSGLGRHAEAIAVYDEVVRRFGEATELSVRVQVAMALVNKSDSLGELDRRAEAIAVCDEVVQRFGEATELRVRVWVAVALVIKGYSLDRPEEELAVYDEVVRRFGEATNPVVQAFVAKALVNKGYSLSKLDRREEELAVYDEVVRRFGEATEPAVRVQVAMALVNKGSSLGELDRHREAIAVYNEVVQRFGEANEAAIRIQVAMALGSKGNSLGELGWRELAIAVYDEVVRRFGEATEPDVREQVEEARANKERVILKQKEGV